MEERFQTPAPGRKVFLDWIQAADHAAGRKIRPLNVFHQLRNGDVGIINLRAHAINDFAEVVRRHIGGHTHGDAGAAVDEEVRKRRREDGRLGASFVIIRHEIDRLFVHVLHQRRSEVRETGLGITHGRRGISFHRAEVALTIDQALSHGPRLRHVYQRGIDDRFAVRMIITAGVPADFGAFAVLPIRSLSPCSVDPSSAVAR